MDVSYSMTLAHSDTISRDDLLAQVKVLGGRLAVELRRAGYKGIPRWWFELTPTQLINWHRHGLIPRPTRRSLGRGRGMESRYPTYTVLQATAVALMQLLFRDLKRVRWAVWCLGFALTEGVRRDLVAEVRRWERQLGKNYRLFENGRPNNPIARLARGRAPLGFGRVRRRVGKDRFETLGRAFHEVLLGKFPDTGTYGADDYALMAQALEALEALDGQKVDAAQIAEAARLLSREASLPALRRVIETIPEVLLCRLRDEAQAVYRSLLAPGFEQAMVPPEFVIWWIALRYTSPTLRKAFDEVAPKMFWGDPEAPVMIRIYREQQKRRARKARRK